MKNQIKIAAIQLNCDFADVKNNLSKAENFIRQAAAQKCELALLPEFFVSAIGFSPKMNDVALQGTSVRCALKTLSQELGIIIGGSFLILENGECYNTFDLVFPGGAIFSHKKDIPTQFENCYYTGGDTEHILHTPIGNVGVALCWEMIRADTLKRLIGKADFILAGSCWWDLPIDAPAEREPLRQYNQSLALETPCVFAKRLHTPVVHANHCGRVTAYRFPSNDVRQTRQLVGATQIVDCNGGVIQRKHFYEGEGIIIADIVTSTSTPDWVPVEYTDYWIPDLPQSYQTAWQQLNPLGKLYYENTVRPFYRGALLQID